MLGRSEAIGDIVEVVTVDLAADPGPVRDAVVDACEHPDEHIRLLARGLRDLADRLFSELTAEGEGSRLWVRGGLRTGSRPSRRNFQGANHARYMNPELDALIDGYFATVPKAERNRFLAQIVRHVSDLAVVLPMAWRADPTPIASRLVNVGVKGPEATQAWNAYQWDVRS